MASLTNNVRVVYNSWRFPLETETESLRLTPVYDSAGRTVVYTDFALRVRCIIQSNNGVDDTIEFVRRTLQKPAAVLEVKSLGTGKLNINAGGTRDVSWGPKPEVVEIKPLGGGNAVELTWAVTARLPDCSQAVHTVPGVVEFNFTVAFGIDMAGKTTRTYSGHVVIPQTRRSATDRTLAFTADVMRGEVVPDPVPGFHRTGQTFTLSEDKCRLDFSVTDTQMGGPAPPPGVVSYRINHRRASTMVTMSQWVETISGNYVLPPNGNPENATRHFFRLVRDRVTVTQVTLRKKNPTAVIVPVEYSDGADFGSDGNPRATFTARFKVTTRLEFQMVGASSLWTPVADSDWQRWQASVPLGPGGHANLTFRPGEDKIVDLCEAGNTSVAGSVAAFVAQSPLFASLTNGLTREATWMDYRMGTKTEVVTNNSVLKTLPEKKKDVDLKTVPADSLGGQLNTAGGGGTALGGAVGGFIGMGDTKPTGGGIAGAIAGGVAGAAGGNRLPAPGGPAGNGSRPNPPAGGGDGFFIDGGGAAKPLDVEDDFFFKPPAAKVKPKPLPNAAPKNNPPPNVRTEKADVTVQQRVTATVYVYLFGQALRVGLPIPEPTLDSIDGVPLIPSNPPGQGYGFVQAVVGSACGVPIYGAKWLLRFVCVKNLPNGVPVVPNPMAG